MGQPIEAIEMFARSIPVVLALGLAGCSSMPFELVEREPQAPAPTSLGISIPPSMSMAALPPAAGSVVSVIERRRGNALQHEVTLHGAPPNYGENQILVTAFRHVSAIPEKPIEDTLPMRAPTQEDIVNEMTEKLVNGPLPISQNAPQNGAGYFAYAFARRAGVSCLYAWQWVEGENKLTTAPVSVRVRLCKPNTTEEVLVDYVRQLYLMPRTRPGASGMVMARGPGGYGDALSASRNGGGYAAYQPHPYGMAYAAPAPAPVAAPAAPARKVAAASVQKRVLVRRIVKRRVVAPQIYSYAPPPVPAVSAPAVSVAPVKAPPPARGYSAVPMPQ
jgi:hypothetical protein